MIAFVFPGQGSQELNMGKEFIENFPEYKNVLDKASEIINVDLYSIIYGEDENKLRLTENAQPSILTISYIAYKYLTEKKDIHPNIVAGHSLGEWTALIAAGVLEFEEAVRLVRLRGIYMEEALPAGKGTMGAVIGLDEKIIEDTLKDFPDVVIANYNTPQQIIISGLTDQVKKALEILKEKGAKKVVQLNVSGPFHSPFMKKAQEKMAQEIEKIEFKKPRIPIVQNVTAKAETDPEKIKENIIKQITSPVKWTESVKNMIEMGVKEFYEVGPGKVLTGLIKKIDRNFKPKVVNKPF